MSYKKKLIIYITDCKLQATVLIKYVKRWGEKGKSKKVLSVNVSLTG
jgi:hypothetical protein